MRQIDWEKPLSEEDKEWVERFGTQAMRRKMERGEKRFAAVESAASEEDEEQGENYEEMTLDELKAEAAVRKAQGFDMTGVKNKAQLIERLRAWDAEE